MRRPEFTIVAGANGTGKSSIGELYLYGIFKVTGYKTRLIFFGIENLEMCVSRVIQRSYTGGHHVSLDVIKFNFEEGIRRVNENLSLFDDIVFVDNSKEKGESIIVALYSKSMNHKVIEESNCVWFQMYFKASFDNL